MMPDMGDISPFSSSLPPASSEYEHRYRIYAGPCIVKELSERLAQNYFDVVLIGTEHVWIDTNCTVEEVLGVLGHAGWHSRDIKEFHVH